jgi:DNA-3-methyladenine glycosylase II
MPKSSARPASHLALRSGMTPARFDLPVLAPCRLDLTVSALRRLSTNMVDVLTPGGAYVRVLGDARAPVFVRVEQTNPKILTVMIEGNPSEHPHALALVRRMLGVDHDLTSFNRTAKRIPSLAPLAHRMLGVKPPRYPTL